MMNLQHSNSRYKGGFTIIELLITIAIIAVLATIAIPSYREFILEARRADGMSAISDLQLAQEKFRANCIEYARATGVSDVCDNTTPANNVVKHSSSSSDGYYTLALSAESATGYTITATPTTKGNQNKDLCKNFILTVAAGTATKSVSGTDDNCWQR